MSRHNEYLNEDGDLVCSECGVIVPGVGKEPNCWRDGA